MTFAKDPAVLRVVDALGGDPRAARAAVRALVTVAPRAMPWFDARDIQVTTDADFEAGALYEALVRARLVVQEEAGIVLTPVGEALRELLVEERAKAAERQQNSRDAKAAVTFRDQRVTSRDIDVTSRSSGEENSSENEDAGVTPGVTSAAASCASPITRAPGARGNSSPSSSPPAPSSSPPPNPPADSGIFTDPAEAYRVATSLRRALQRSITAPPALADIIAEDLLAGRVTPDELMAAAKQSPRHGGKSYAYLLALVESAREAEAASRAPPPAGQRGPNDPVPIEERRMLREWEQRGNGGEEW